MIDSPKVCVAICNFNHSKYLRESLESIIGQDYKNLDIAVIDDGSDDQETVKEIVNSIDDKRIRLICLEKNSGKWNALNLAFSTTDATFCTSHDADDISLSWRISSQVEVLTSTKTLHNLCGFISCWNDEEMNLKSSLVKPEKLKATLGDDVTNEVLHGISSGINHYFTGNFKTAGTSAMFHKLVWDLGIRFNPPKLGLRVLMSEDSDFNCRATLLLRSTSLLLETPYLYRRNTSTNKEER